MSSSNNIPVIVCSVPDEYLYIRQACSFSSSSLVEIENRLSTQELSPLQQQELQHFWCAHPPPKHTLYALLEKEHTTSNQVLALNVLACQQEIVDLEILWTVFIESRMGLRIEDPDLFTRALRIIVDIEKKYPHSQGKIWTEQLPFLLQKATLHHEHTSLDILSLRILLEKYYTQYALDGILAFDSEGGSLFQEIIQYAEEEKKEIPSLPQNKPGQYQQLEHTEFYQSSISKYHPSWSIPTILVSVFLLCCSVACVRSFYKKSAAILLSISILSMAEGICELIHLPTRAEQAPLFSFIDFSFAPYQSYQRGNTNWWISQGGPSRWQEIPADETIFRIAVLGASSAHASNLLQEEGFSAILEQQLQEEYPNTPIQVVNMAIGGTISNGILSSGKQAIEMGSDAIIIYYGHNEVSQFLQLNQMGAASSIGWRLFFAQSHLYGLLNTLLSSNNQEKNSEKIDSTQNDPNQVREWAFQNHYQNLHLLLAYCSQQQIPVLQITPTYNFRFAPAMHNPKIQDAEASIAALEQAKAMRPHNIKKAQILLETLLEQVPEGSAIFLEGQEILAHILSEQNHHSEARKAYQKYFDHALEVTTIHSRIKENIIKLAQQHGTAHLDAEDVFYHHSPDGITANGLFWDELHPSQKGHQYLAKAIIPWAREQTSHFLGLAPNP